MQFDHIDQIIIHIFFEFTAYLKKIVGEWHIGFNFSQNLEPQFAHKIVLFSYHFLIFPF